MLPLWVADMDFETSSYIEDALVRADAKRIFGYSECRPLIILKSWQSWMKLLHNWEIQEDWLIKTPGVVFALAMAVSIHAAGETVC